jgi:hypothetical protein
MKCSTRECWPAMQSQDDFAALGDTCRRIHQLAGESEVSVTEAGLIGTEPWWDPIGYVKCDRTDLHLME